LDLRGALSGLVEDEPDEALEAFREIVNQEEEKGDWSVFLSTRYPLTFF
jgi:hypothetical protein